MKSLNKDLFVTFMKIGGFTLGGGAAMIPLMEQQVVTQRRFRSQYGIPYRIQGRWNTFRHHRIARRCFPFAHHHPSHRDHLLPFP